MRASRAIKRQRSRDAFTLVELLVAMTVVLILVLMLTTIFSQATSAWTSGEDGVARRRTGRSLVDFIANELQGALLPVNASAAAGKGNLQFLIDPPVTQVPRDQANADTIFWQASLASESTLGDVAEVGYFVKWVASGRGSRPTLCRYFVNPSVSGAAGVPGPNPDFKIYDPSNPNSWLTPGLLLSVAPATSAQGYKGLFAENVIGFWVRAFGADGVELPKIFDSRVGYNCPSQTAGSTATVKRYLPATLRISVAQLDARLAPRVDAAYNDLISRTAQSKTGDDAASFLANLSVNGTPATNVLLPGIHVYSTEVTLQNSR